MHAYCPHEPGQPTPPHPLGERSNAPHCLGKLAAEAPQAQRAPTADTAGADRQLAAVIALAWALSSGGA